MLKLVGHCKDASFGSCGVAGRKQGCGLLLGCRVSGPRLGLLLFKSEAGGCLAEGGQRKFAKTAEMERTRL